VFAIPPSNVPALQAICDTFDVHLTDIGEFTGSGRLVVRYNGKAVLDLENRFLHDGIPQRRLKAEIHRREEEKIHHGEHREHGEEEKINQEINRREREERREENIKIKHGDTERKELLQAQKTPCLSISVVQDFNDTLLALLAHPNIASKAPVIHIYDHEVQGGTVVKPLSGAENDGPSDACVLKPIGTRGMGGIVLSNGINPEYGKLDAYAMSWSVIDEAIRNAVAVGCDPQRIALLDNFCWGDPLRPETLWSLVEACRGCHDAALHFRTPFISGKDSLNNEYLGSDGQRHAIPPTLLISAMGLIEDVSLAVTMDFKQAGDVVYLVGEFQPAFGGSHYTLIHPAEAARVKAVPAVPVAAPDTYRLVHTAMQRGLVRACHDLSEGGLGVAAAEMCIGGRLGMMMTPLPAGFKGGQVTPRIPPAPSRLAEEELLLALFGETNGCLLVEVRAGDQAAYEKLMAGAAFCQLGSVTAEPLLSIGYGDEALVRLPVEQLLKAWQRE
jgi:phosphoribosylformylglycinamidine (FGAM) synthase-like enzyme